MNSNVCVLAGARRECVHEFFFEYFLYAERLLLTADVRGLYCIVMCLCASLVPLPVSAPHSLDLFCLFINVCDVYSPFISFRVSRAIIKFSFGNWLNQEDRFNNIVIVS